MYHRSRSLAVAYMAGQTKYAHHSLFSSRSVRLFGTLHTVPPLYPLRYPIDSKHSLFQPNPEEHMFMRGFASSSRPPSNTKGSSSFASSFASFLASPEKRIYNSRISSLPSSGHPNSYNPIIRNSLSSPRRFGSGSKPDSPDEDNNYSQEKPASLWDITKDALSFSRTKDLQSTLGKHPTAGEIQHRNSLRAILRALAGNIFIASLKFTAWWATKSSAMLAEAIHTLVDAGNQALLLLGSRQSKQAPDSVHPYGYGKAAFFWSLVSALGTFWLGAGITISHGLYTVLHPMESLEITWHTWAVLATSFAVDGIVLQATLRDLWEEKPKDVSLYKYISKLNDPLVLAVILEDLVATSGVIVAGIGIGLTEMTGNVMWDGLASVVVGGMLGFVALSLVKLNQRFLLGLAVDRKTQQHISNMLLSRSSIEAVYGIQCEWVGPSSFAYRAEIDFDGTHFAQKLEARYLDMMYNASREELGVIMGNYAEDVTRLVEKEILSIEKDIRKIYPEAVFIELEPKGSASHMSSLLSRIPRGENFAFASTSAAAATTSPQAAETETTSEIPAAETPSVEEDGEDVQSPQNTK